MKQAAAVSLKLTQVLLGATQVFNLGQTAAVNNSEIENCHLGVERNCLKIL